MAIFGALEKKAGVLPLAASKLFGDPHVPEGFVWPTASDGDEQFDLSFIAQIDCAELSGLDREGVLPRFGMLYFFYDLDGLPRSGGGRVIYYDGYLDDLFSMVLTDEHGEPIALKEYGLAFSEREGGAVCRLLDGGELFSLSPFEDEDIKLTFGGGTLVFELDREGIKKRDFSTTKTHIKEN